ncbi:hypothetical protein B0A49_03009 [Cryomyces minteri]|uniref:Fructose-bisphosphate aldolase n=1 Tax=Cryomyces minteri TaxID=331657 RepID=A0A4U0XGH9_9PEZI|nr:hypothetical protein B0A49_03009 [Cryomyces minteri]
MPEKLKNNRAIAMLDAAADGGYGVLGIVSYNLETIVAAVRAAERKRSPIQILLFPWAIHYANGLLVNLAADACRSASVPITLHMDHAQEEDIIVKAADMQTQGQNSFDSIMIDMSHYEKEENLAKTKKLVAHCHERGIATEAEPGRIEGGEDGVKDTAELEGLLTTPEEAQEFIDTGIDFLAPAFGNLHGDYFGVKNIKLDYPRLDSIHRKAKGQVQIVLHGTNEFPPDILQKCIKSGVTRINVNKLVLHKYNAYVEENTGKVPLTELMEKGTQLIQGLIEEHMDNIGSTGKA